MRGSQYAKVLHAVDRGSKHCEMLTLMPHGRHSNSSMESPRVLVSESPQPGQRNRYTLPG